MPDMLAPGGRTPSGAVQNPAVCRGGTSKPPGCGEGRAEPRMCKGPRGRRPRSAGWTRGGNGGAGGGAPEGGAAAAPVEGAGARRRRAGAARWRRRGRRWPKPARGTGPSVLADQDLEHAGEGAALAGADRHVHLGGAAQVEVAGGGGTGLHVGHVGDDGLEVVREQAAAVQLDDPAVAAVASHVGTGGRLRRHQHQRLHRPAPATCPPAVRPPCHPWFKDPGPSGELSGIRPYWSLEGLQRTSPSATRRAGGRRPGAPGRWRRAGSSHDHPPARAR